MNYTKKILNNYKIKLIKKKGQNFLINDKIIDKIIKISNFNYYDGIIEIGAGIGNLTNKLIHLTQKIVAIEIDKNFVFILKKELNKYSNLKIINDNFLNLNLKQIIQDNFFINQKIHIISNLPYFITSQIILKLLENFNLFNSFTLMMQKEVAQRFCAKIKTKLYNHLSIMCQFYCDIKIIFNINPKNFIPIPNVISSVVYFKINPKFQLNESKLFWLFVKNCFLFKRKILINNLSKYLNNKEKAINIIKLLSWPLTIRAEELTFLMFYKLFNKIKK